MTEQTIEEFLSDLIDSVQHLHDPLPAPSEVTPTEDTSEPKAAGLN